MGAGEFGKTQSACNTFMMLQRVAGEWYRESVRERETTREAVSGRRKPRGGKQRNQRGEEAKEGQREKERIDDFRD